MEVRKNRRKAGVKTRKSRGAIKARGKAGIQEGRGEGREESSGVIVALLYSKEGREKKEVSLNAKIFGAPINKRLLNLAERAFSANLRSGTASTKTRGEVRGGGKKPWRQKGTGRARHGSIRSPIWRHGGVVFGPRPRDYSVNMPEGMKKQALISALSLRAKEKNVLIMEESRLEKPKTSEFLKVLKTLPLGEKRMLYVLKEMDPIFKRATQNLSGVVEVKVVSDLNAYHVLRRPKLVIEEEALAVLESRLLDENWSRESVTAGQKVKEKEEVSQS